MCVNRQKVLTVSVGLGYKILREWIRCLYNYVIDRLSEATSQSINGRGEKILRLNTNQITLIRVPIVN